MTTGYSGTPLSKKLGIKSGILLVAVDAPDNYHDLLLPIPENVEIVDAEADRLQNPSQTKNHAPAEKADIIHLFTNNRDGLFGGLVEAKHLIKQDGMIWVSWFKKAAKLPTEITEDTVREAALPLGLVDVKVCAVDEKSSGLKLVIRRENRI
jgi:hypothetical protein